MQATALPSIAGIREANPTVFWSLLLSTPKRLLVCEADGILIALHPHCQACGILLGDCHDDPASDEGLCESCRP